MKRALLTTSFIATLGLLSTSIFADTTVQTTPPSATVQTTPPNTTVTTPQGTVVQPAPVVTTPPTQQQTTVVTPPPQQPVVYQSDHHDWPGGELTLNAGPALFTGKSHDYLNDSIDLALGVYGRMSQFSQMGFELGYVTGAKLKGTLPDRLNPALNGGAPFTADNWAHIGRVTPEIQLGPYFQAGAVGINPYIIGGGGFYWTHYNDKDLEFWGGNNSVTSNNDYNGGWNAGGGILLSFSHAIGIGFDVRYHDIVYKNSPDTTWVAPSGRLTFQF